MKNKNGNRAAPRRIQFEATALMASAIDSVVDSSAKAGVKITASHICRIAVAAYLSRLGYLENPDGFAALIGTVAANG